MVSAKDPVVIASIAVIFIEDSVSCIIDIAHRVLYQRFRSMTQSFRGLYHCSPCTYQRFCNMAQRIYGLYHDHHDRRVFCIDDFTKRSMVWVKA